MRAAPPAVVRRPPPGGWGWLRKDEGGRMKDEGEETSSLPSSFILHPSSFGWGWAVCLLLLLPGAARPARADDLVIGMSAAFTGPSRALGIEFYRGAMACFAEVNRQG